MYAIRSYYDPEEKRRHNLTYVFTEFLEGLGESDPAAEGKREQDAADLLEDVVDRQEREHVHGGVEIKVLLSGDDVGDDVAVGEHRPLGAAGRSGGVEDNGRLILVARKSYNFV